MPIRPEFRHFYGKVWYEEIRPRILKRAGNRCEQCGKPDRAQVWVYKGVLGQYWTLLKGIGQKWRYCAQEGATGSFGLFGGQWREARRIRVLLQVAHLNHTPGDDRDENLKAWCQWCHLLYDRQHHKATRTTRKDSSRPLIEAVIEEQQRQEGAAYVCQEVTAIESGNLRTIL